jgi:hypothetical protein
MISLLWLHVLFITESFHVSIISPNLLLCFNSFCLKRVVWPSFTKEVCDHETLFTTKALLIPGGDWRSWVGMNLEKANVGLGFFLWIGRHWEHGQIASTWNHHVQCFFLTKIVVFWTKKLGMICEINKKSCKLEYISIFLYFKKIINIFFWV